MLETISRLALYPGLLHGFSTRQGGVSAPPHASLNMAYARPDDPAAVQENRRRFAAALGFDLNAVVIAGQVHGTTVRRASAVDKGRGAYGANTVLPPADALITNHPGVVLWAGFADCTPLLFYDPVQQAVGVAHAGWQGTVGNIVGATVAAMTHEFGSNPSDLLAAIGPAIGPCCYEVGEPVVSAVATAFGADVAADLLPRPPGSERPHFDLWSANAHWLQAAGVQPCNILRQDCCTACNVERFFSHRREQGATGRFAAVIGIREP